MNLYPQFENKICSEIAKNNVSSVGDVWDCFKSVYCDISSRKPTTLVELGVQAEVYHGDEYEKASFYFALHYRVSVVEDNEEYSFYELVYCDFAISDLSENFVLKEESIDVCESDCSQTDLFAKIEAWQVFGELKELVLPLTVHSDEV